MAVSLGGTAYAFNAAAGASLSSGAVSADPTAGATVLALITHGWDGSEAISSVTDNAGGNTYSLCANTHQRNNGVACAIWMAENVNTTAGFALTANWNASTLNPNRSIRVVIIEGAATSGALDLSNGTTQSSVAAGTDTLTTGSLGTPSTDGQMVVGVIGIGSSPDNLNPGTGFTGIGSYPYNEYNRGEYLIQGSAAAVAVTFTADATVPTVAIAGVSIKAAAGGGSIGFDDGDGPVFLIRQRPATTVRLV